jgi:hypothetical protein
MYVFYFLIPRFRTSSLKLNGNNEFLSQFFIEDDAPERIKTQSTNALSPLCKGFEALVHKNGPLRGLFSDDQFYSLIALGTPLKA